MASGRAKVEVKIVGDAKGFHVAMRRATWDAMTFAAKMRTIGGQLQTVGKRMTQTVTVPIVAGLTLATKAAVEEEKEMALLATALKNTAKATNAEVKATEAWITATQNATGIADGELRPALANLVRVTGDIAEAQDMMGAAMDIAVAKGKSMESITMAMAKAYNGNVGALGRMGIATRDAEGKLMTFEQVMKRAAQTFGGSAAQAATTTAGKMAILKARFADIAESVGNAVIPILEKLVPYIQKVANWFENLTDGQRSFLVKAALIGAAAGPVMAIIGTFVKWASTIGTVTRALASLVRKLIAVKAAAVAAEAPGFWKAGMWTQATTGATTLATKLVVLKTAIAAIGPAAYLAAAALGTFYAASVKASSVSHNFYGGGKGGSSRGQQQSGGSRPPRQDAALTPGLDFGPRTPASLTIPIYLDGREIAAYAVDLMAGNARRMARGMA